MTPTPNAPSAEGGFEGKNYRVVSFAVDLTGKKLIDEICQIAAYYEHPEPKSFSQYIMPYRDVSLSASRAHGIRIFVNFGRFRVMKDMNKMKNLRTKSDYATLCDFQEWLKEAGVGFDGLVLAYHDNYQSNVVPFLLEALEKYKMTEDFFGIVKGFVNASDIGSNHADFKGKSVTLKAMARRTLDMEDPKGISFQSAKNRAETIYKLVAKLTKPEGGAIEGGDADANAVKGIALANLIKFCTTRKDEYVVLEKQREMAKKVSSLRPIFVQQIRSGPKNRSRAVLLRRYLIDTALDYSAIKSAFEAGPEALSKLVEGTPAKKKAQDMEELVKLINKHFTDGGKKEEGNKENGGAGKEPKKKPRKPIEGDGLGKSRIDSAGSTGTDEDESSGEEEFEEAKTELAA